MAQIMNQENIMKQGAEARIFRAEICGRECVIKERFRKKYRNAQLDSKLLSKRICAGIFD